MAGRQLHAAVCSTEHGVSSVHHAAQRRAQGPRGSGFGAPGSAQCPVGLPVGPQLHGPLGIGGSVESPATGLPGDVSRCSGSAHAQPVRCGHCPAPGPHHHGAPHAEASSYRSSSASRPQQESSSYNRRWAAGPEDSQQVQGSCRRRCRWCWGGAKTWAQRRGST